jgi:hypothetical protein
MSERVKIGSTPILHVWYLSAFKVFSHFPHAWKHFARALLWQVEEFFSTF